MIGQDLNKEQRQPRKKIPASVRQQVLMEAGYKCGNPVCRAVLTLDLHHIVPISAGGNNDTNNLLALCGYCHDMHTHGKISLEAIRHWKGMLLALNHAFDRYSMDVLLALRKINRSIFVTGDGLLRLASLVASGLLSCNNYSDKWYRGPSHIESGAYVDLSEKGKLLVDAWVTGDEGKYREILSDHKLSD